jgi:hypothetical protein
MENRYTSDYTFQSQIQASVTGALTETEQQALAAQLANDAPAQEEFMFSKNLALALNNQELFAVSAMMNQIIVEESLPEPDNTPDAPAKETPQYEAGKSALSNVKTWIWGAAAIVLIGAATFGTLEWQKTTQKALGAQLAQEYLQPLENNIFSTTELNGLDDLNEGMKAYNSKDYRKAAQLLGKRYRFTKDANVGLYYAVSMLMIDEPVSEVEKVLSDITPKLPEPMRYDAEWYTALTLLKAGKLDELEAYLPKINDQSPHKKAAIELLKDLKE